MSAVVPAALPVAGHAAPKPVVRIDVTLYNRTKGFEKTAQFATWMTTSRPNPGPIKTVHISNCMFNLTTLQDPEARSDLGPTTKLGPRLGGASVNSGLGPRLYRASVALR